MNSRTIGVLSGILGILMFSSKAVMVKMAYQYEVDSVSLLLLRMVFALPFYLVIAFIKKPEKTVGRKDYAWLVAFGIIGYYLASYFDFVGLTYIKASLERLILFIYPTLVVFISFVAFRKKITKWQAIGIGVTYAGIIVIFGTELQIGNQDAVIKGGVLVFLSALTYAAYLVGSGWLIPKFGASVFTAYAMIVSCLAVIIHYFFESTPSLIGFEMEVYIIGFLMALIATVIPSFLISYAIKNLGASQFSIFGSLGPVSTITLAYIFLNERISLLQIVGACIIILGIYVAEKKRV